MPIVITITNPAKKQRMFSSTGCLNINKGRINFLFREWATQVFVLVVRSYNLGKMWVAAMSIISHLRNCHIIKTFGGC